MTFWLGQVFQFSRVLQLCMISGNYSWYGTNHGLVQAIRSCSLSSGRHAYDYMYLI